MVIEYLEVLAVTTGGDREAANLVRGDFTGQFDCIGEKVGGIGLGAHAGLGGQEGMVRLKVWMNVCFAGLV